MGQLLNILSQKLCKPQERSFERLGNLLKITLLLRRVAGTRTQLFLSIRPCSRGHRDAVLLPWKSHVVPKMGKAHELHAFCDFMDPLFLSAVFHGVKGQDGGWRTDCKTLISLIIS